MPRVAFGIVVGPLVEVLSLNLLRVSGQQVADLIDALLCCFGHHHWVFDCGADNDERRVRDPYALADSRELDREGTSGDRDSGGATLF